ncbi:MAG TPA: hypothetical protein VHB97_09975 [Polyangia bacterium]|nr:hypothetical protein [Polyangia bacterium]
MGLAAPSLTTGFVADDWLQLLITRGWQSRLPGLPTSKLDLFSFAGHTVGGNLAAMDTGMFPWWADPECKLAFFRPLASLTHILDWTLWPDSPVVMHAHNLLWFALACTAVAFVYRRFCADAFTAGLATLLYAWDDAHGPALGWIANRNAMMALAFALPVLIIHDRVRRDGWRPGVWLGPLLLGVALCCGESALAVVGYLVAHAICLDHGKLATRLLRLWPYLVVVILWRTVYDHLGYGTANSGIYLDPGASPRAFWTAFPERALWLVAGQLAGPWSDLGVMFPYMSMRIYHVALVAAAAGAAFVIAFLVPQVRRDPTARFFALGAAFCIVPIASTFPSDRLLWFVGIGAMALIAQFLTTRPLAPAGKLAFAFLIVVHVILAPPLLAVRSRSMDTVDLPLKRGDHALPSTPDMVDRTVVLVNPPADFYSGYLPIRRAAFGEPRPKFRSLATGFDGVKLTRVDDRTLVVTPAKGYLFHISEHMLRSRPMAPHASVHLTGVQIDVLTMTADGRPASARFRFDVPLEDRSLYFAKWVGRTYQPFPLPAIGETVVLPPIDFLESLAKD